jgi:N-acetyl-anhydromuramyl-L-alanine amidase AmpD
MRNRHLKWEDLHGARILRTAVTCLLSALVACGPSPQVVQRATAQQLSGPRNEALFEAASKRGVPAELLMLVAYQQTRFETRPGIEGDNEQALSTVEPPLPDAPAVPVDVSQEIEPTAAPSGGEQQEPDTFEPALELSEDVTDFGLQTALEVDTAADDAEAAAPTPLDDEEAAKEGDAHLETELFGVMALTEAQVVEAAQLTQRTEADIRRDFAANVDAAAALLSAHAQRLGVDRSSSSLEAWKPAVAALLGADDDVAVTRVMMETLFEIERNGFEVLADDGERIELRAPEGTRAQQQELRPGAYPPIEFIPASSRNYSSRSGGKVRFVVVHDIEGTMPGAIAVFRNPNRQASAHYIVRARDGHIVQMVSEANKAWHSGHGYFNANSIGIEHEGFADRPRGGGYYTATQYQASANLVCAIAKKYRIPIDRKHIVGHGNVPSSRSSTTLCSDAAANAGRCGGAGHHHDPGRFWDWSTYMRLIARCVSPSTPPPNPPPPTAGTATVKGLVTKAGTSTRLPAATVRLGTLVTKSDANGVYVFRQVPTGTRTVTVSLSGYQTQAITRVVKGPETWGSVALRPNAPSGTGVLTGVVYRGADTGNRVAGATVTLSNGRSTTTNAAGVYEFRQLAPGVVRITAVRSGVGSGSSTRTVVNGSTVWGSVRL